MTELRSDETDCRSEAGVTVGLIDALITTCRVLAKRDLTQAREALADLACDEDVAAVWTAAEVANLIIVAPVVAAVSGTTPTESEDHE